MDPTRAHIILPTNATSAANPLAATTPTAVALDTVIQTNREGEPLEYREIITTEKVLHPTLLENAPPPHKTTTTTTTTTVEEVPMVSVPGVATTTTVVKEVPTSTDYVVKQAAAFKPVVTESHVTTVTKPVTTKITKTETVETTK
jgi:hypothetical protein